MTTVPLGDGKLAVVSIELGTKMMEHLREGRKTLKDRPHHVTNVTVSIRRDGSGTSMGNLTGSAFCNPLDTYDPDRGTLMALGRAFDQDAEYKLLNKAERAALASALVPHAGEKQRRVKKVKDMAPVDAEDE